MTAETALARIFKPAQADEVVQLLDERELAKFVLMIEEVEAIAAAATAGQITTLGECASAVELIARGTKAFKELEDLRRSRVDPLNAEVRSVNTFFKRVTDPLQALAGKMGTLETKVLAFRRAEKLRQEREAEAARLRQQEALRKEQEALAKAEAAKTQTARQKHLATAQEATQQQAWAEADESAARARAATKGVKTDSGSVTARERWVLHGVHDYDAIPPSFWEDPLVREALHRVLQRAITGGAREIPGCSIGLEEGLTRRTG